MKPLWQNLLSELWTTINTQLKPLIIVECFPPVDRLDLSGIFFLEKETKIQAAKLSMKSVPCHNDTY